MTENEIAPKAQTDLAKLDYGADAGKGVADIGRDEAGIPFLKILQAQSPEVQGSSGKVEGAKAGMFLNTGTAELSESIEIVPACRQHVFVEWKPRNQGGGIVKVYQPNDPVVLAAQAECDAAIAAEEPSRRPSGGIRKFGELYTEAGNALVETFYVFSVVMEDDDPAGFIVVPFSSTQIKKYKKKFANRIRYCMVNGQLPPMFAHRLVLTTELESRDNYSWFGYVIKFAVENNVKKTLSAKGDVTYDAGEELYNLFTAGDVEADLSKAAEEDEGEEADAAPF